MNKISTVSFTIAVLVGWVVVVSIFPALNVPLTITSLTVTVFLLGYRACEIWKGK